MTTATEPFHDQDRQRLAVESSDTSQYTQERAALLAQSRTRCQQLRLTAQSVTQKPRTAVPGRRLLDVAGPFLEARHAEVTDLGAALVLTDGVGAVSAIWSGAGEVADTLDALGLLVGAVASESALGTSCFSALVSHEPTVVHGREHLHPALAGWTTAGIAVQDRATRRHIGSLNVVVASGRGQELVVLWLRSVVRELEDHVYARTTRAESSLMDRYLHEIRDSRHAVVALNDKTIITNAAAARLVGVEEQSVLWEHACEVLRNSTTSEDVVQVGRGLTLHVVCTPVTDEDRVIGAVMRLKRQTTREALQDQGHLPGLVGNGPAWESMRRKVAAASTASLLLVGERGVGKRAVARASCAGQHIVELDAHHIHTVGATQWLHRLHQALAEGPDILLLSHVHLVQDQLADGLITAMQSHPEIRFVATSLVWPGQRSNCVDALEQFHAVVPVPALRERLEDLPALVKHFTLRQVRETPRLDGVQWMTDALQALARVSWTANVASLGSLVPLVLSGCATRYVGVRDLPSDVVVRASGRVLGGLERVEANAILQAVQDAQGNKHLAAESLGIARSTLYRKMRSLGVDLGSSTF